MPRLSSVSSERSRFAQADQRDVEPRSVEARNHPREQPLDPVHAGAGPAEVIADVDDVQLAHGKGHSRQIRQAARRTWHVHVTAASPAPVPRRRAGDAGLRDRRPDCSPAPSAPGPSRTRGSCDRSRPGGGRAAGRCGAAGRSPSHTAPASHTGHTGKCTAGGLTPSSRAISATSSLSVVYRGPASRYVRPAAAGTVAHSRRPAHEIVDVGEVIEDLAAPEHGKASAGDAAKHLQEARVARPIDANRPRDHDVEPAAAAELRGEPLGVELGALIDVARERTARPRLPAATRRGRGRRRCCSAPRAGRRRRAPPRARGGCLRRSRGGRRCCSARLPVGRGDVVDELAAGDGALDARRIRQIADADLDALAPSATPRVRRCAGGPARPPSRPTAPACGRGASR